MRSKITSYFLCLFLALLLASPVLAADIGLGNGGLAQQVANSGGYTTSGVTDTSLSQSIGLVVKVVISFIGTIFFVLTVYAGFLWMTAQGNEEQVAKSTGILKMAVIGMIISVASYIISVFILATITGATINTATQNLLPSGASCTASGNCASGVCNFSGGAGKCQ